MLNLLPQQLNKNKEEQQERRRKRREYVLRSQKEEVTCNDKELRELLIAKQKMYHKLKSSRDEITHLKTRLKSMGGVTKLTSLKDEYKELVEQNYSLYDEVKTLQKDQRRQAKAMDEVTETVPAYEDRISVLKQQIEAEKGKNQALSEKSKELDTKLKTKFNSNIKIKEEQSKLNQELSLLEQGKRPKNVKEIEKENQYLDLKYKIESLKKIRGKSLSNSSSMTPVKGESGTKRKTQVDKYKVALTRIKKDTKDVEKEILESRLMLDQLSKEVATKTKKIYKLKQVVRMQPNQSMDALQHQRGYE